LGRMGEDPAQKSATRMGSLLLVKDLTKQFPLAGSRQFVHAVTGVTLDIRPGETVALVGESGSGKTTVGRCVMGLLRVTAGVVAFRDVEVNSPRTFDYRRVRGKIQLVFQEPGESLDPKMRVGQSIEEPLWAAGWPVGRRRNRVQELTELVGLPNAILGRYPWELSAGQQQRVAIARAIATNPELVVLDEPTSALDPTARADTIELLLRIQDTLSTAYLFISHDLSTVRHISHRVAVMYLGTIVEHGWTLDIFERPTHPYTIGLLSSVMLPDPRRTLHTGLQLKGEIPSPINLPTGCYLASRCPLADERCRFERPPAVEVSSGHLVHCFKHAETTQFRSISQVGGAVSASATDGGDQEVPDGRRTGSLPAS
jgi:oligopeptide/dipeptide ABC transporter ATP-binding protein